MAEMTGEASPSVGMVLKAPFMPLPAARPVAPAAKPAAPAATAAKDADWASV